MNKPIKKAIIPAAGLGTRFLPATKTVPKEMLTVVDAPIIFYVVEEAISAGIEDIILIQGRGKTAIEDFFDTSYELEDKLARDKKFHILERLTQIRSMANIISIRQKQPLGLGHAVLCAQSIIGDDPFAVLLGDEIMIPHETEQNTLGQMVQAYNQTSHSTVAIMEVLPEDVSKYGIADIESTLTSPYRVKGFIEKPSMQKAPSRWALPGRYILKHNIFDYLANATPGAQGELQLTDAMDKIAKKEPFFATPFKADRYDAGDKLGYLKANIEVALKHPELKEALSHYLRHELLPNLNKKG